MSEQKKIIDLPANSPFVRKPFGGLDANWLRLLAVLFMLSDHMWATVIPGNMWMTYIGRIAFPIFAFQIAEGYIHTSDLGRYVRRLLIFALISEIPFNLIMEGSIIFPFHQNVLFTFLLGIMAIRGIDIMRRERRAKNVILGTLLLSGALLLSLAGFVDYGAMGVLTVLIFYIFRSFPFAWLFQLASMVLLYCVLFQGQYIPLTLFGLSIEFQTQGFAVLSLIPIWLYNGSGGRKSKALQYGFYAFYPAHMLILYLLGTYFI